MQTLPITLLKIACLATIATGLVSAAASHPAADAPWALLFDLLQWPLDGAQGAFSNEARVLSAVCGGVLAGWGAIMYWLAAGPVATDYPGARRAFGASLLLWFAIDSTASLLAGWPGNVVLNVTFLVAFLAPLAALSRGNRKS
jgi:hypothetical protein